VTALKELAVAALAASCCLGCAAGFAVGLGPRVDTDGVVAIEIGLRGDFGMGVESQAIVAEAGAAGGVGFSPAAPSVGVDAGFAYQQELVDTDLALRGGLRSRFQWTHGDDWRNAMGLGGTFAVLPTLREGDTWTEHLGAEAAGYWLSVEPGPRADERRNTGLFSLMIVYSRLYAVAGPQLAFLPGAK
jgi:hypothetical protein